MATPSIDPVASAQQAIGPEVLQRISELLASLQYGSVEIVVHDGRIVQIERREKVRFGKG